MSAATATARRPKAAPTAVEIESGRLLNLLADAEMFASGDLKRPVLASLRLVLDGSTLTAYATDSYTLVERSTKVDESGEWERFLTKADRKMLTAILKAHATQTVRIVPEHNYLLTLTIGTTRCTVGERVEGWPDFSKLWNGLGADTSSVVALNAKFLSRLARLSGIGKVDPKPVITRFHGELKPVSWSLAGDDGEARGLIMPVRQR